MMITPPRIKVSAFDQPLPQGLLNIEEKFRSNLFAWRGQFSPQLVESLFRAYCPEEAVVLDPFSGSGTTLYEAGSLHKAVYGFEVNPAAWILSRVYEFINIDKEKRRLTLDAVKAHLFEAYPSGEIFYTQSNAEITPDDFSQFLASYTQVCSKEERTFIEALVILLDLFNKNLTAKLLYDYFYTLYDLVLRLPYSRAPLMARLADARSLPLADNTIDFVLTSPPYINVFNYHQNYRRSAETLGWNLLTIAKSEIGSNRANRGNRFLTVIQYCIDMAHVLHELHRVCRVDARAILVVGHESNVLGVPFYNANLIKHLAQETNSFSLRQCQKREFKNKFGQMIREDLLHFSPTDTCLNNKDIAEIARHIAKQILIEGLPKVAEKNRSTLLEAIENVSGIDGTPILETDTEKGLTLDFDQASPERFYA